MAVTSFGVNHPMAVKLWRKKLFTEALKQTSFSGLVGKTSDSVIQFVTETQKDKGDRITVGLRLQLSGSGISGDGTLEGNEEALSIYSDNILIDQLRHAVRSGGKMSEQRVPFEIRDEAMAGLRDWWADRLDTSFFNQVSGYVTQNDLRYTGNNAIVASDSQHIIRVNANETADQSISTTSTMNLLQIDRCIAYAKATQSAATSGSTTTALPIRPAKIDGQEKYVMFLHPYQVYSLRTSTTTGQWLDIQKAALSGSSGGGKNNPIFSGALGEYNNTILIENARVPQGYTSVAGNATVANTRRAIFMGAQAALLAVGKGGNPDSMTWVEEEFDYENQLGVSAGMIYGLKKTVFNSADFATIVCATYAAAP